MIMRGVEGTFLRLTMVDKLVTSYKADDEYENYEKYENLVTKKLKILQ